MKPNTIECGDSLTVLKTWPDACIDCVVTSPPYFGLRDYGSAGQMGLEPNPAEYVANMATLFLEIRRVLKNTGTLWLNIGDSYASDAKGSGGPSLKQDSNGGSKYAPRKFNHGQKNKDLMGIPWRLAFALQDSGWYLRSDIIWHKPNPMPESVTDRPTKAHEYLFLLSKSPRYYYDADAIAEPIQSDRAPTRKAKATGAGTNGAEAAGGRAAGSSYDGTETERNARTVWTIPTTPYKGAHFATFPTELVRPCILAGCPVDGVVLDPFMGSGTTALVAAKLGRKYAGIELNPKYINLARERLGLFAMTT